MGFALTKRDLNGGWIYFAKIGLEKKTHSLLFCLSRTRPHSRAHRAACCSHTFPCISLSTKQSTQTELDGYVAAECVLCGDIMVQSVGKPLVSPEELEELSNLWAL